MECFAAIDIGSNAIRLMVGVRDKKNRVRVLNKFREPVRLGQDVFTNQRISESSILKLVSAMKDFKAITDSMAVSRLRAVGTSALRESRNKDEVIERVFLASNILIETIDYKEEALLISSAVQQAINYGEEATLLFDIGGGSVEFILSQGGLVRDVVSFPAGTLRMLSQVRNSDDHEGLVRVVDSLEEKFRSWFNNRYQPIKHIVGTGGNLECIGGLRRLLLGQKSDRLIRTDELYILIGILTGLTYSQRRRELNLRPDRADVLVPAMMVCKMVFRVVEKSKICIPRVGLRDGLILALSENAPSSSPV